MSKDWGDPNDFPEEARCPACGEFASYCQGHGEIGDPFGAAILEDHDYRDLHTNCHPLACEEAVL